MNKPRILLAAPRSGSGKTLITTALIRAMQRRGLRVSAFKTGPDYIDPMFHRQVLKVPSDNLDLFFAGEEGVRDIFARNASDELSVIEGVMGLYDGMGGIREEGSAYHLACALKAPVLLIVDARGMARSVLAEIAGFLSMDHEHRIAGILCNRLPAMLVPEIRRYVEEQFHIPMLGTMPSDSSLHLESRYLGLKLPGEVADLEAMLDRAAQQLESSCDLDRLLEIARSAEEISRDAEEIQEEVAEGDWGKNEPVCAAVDGVEADTKKSETLSVDAENSASDEHGTGRGNREDRSRVRIAVARDDAFCFYYAENLRLLERLGAELVEFSPLSDARLPENIQGLILGGGYPEQYARALSENTSMRESIRQALEQQLPSLAECGGFMYLHETITDRDGKSWPMVGAVQGDCHDTGRLVRFGYITLTEKTPAFMDEGESIRAHEFHYFDSDNNGNACVAKKPVGTRSWETSHVSEYSFWGYPHLYYLSNSHFAERFLEGCRKFCKNCVKSENDTD
ncbi:MAG: cobyrinate a,c-diamide synthase [Lachnospiraceae bacterium]|nr:cobyrinate a,c-diamide synthase [Lachnospiraceae bacterium]